MALRSWLLAALALVMWAAMGIGGRTPIPAPQRVAGPSDDVEAAVFASPGPALPVVHRPEPAQIRAKAPDEDGVAVLPRPPGHDHAIDVGAAGFEDTARFWISPLRRGRGTPRGPPLVS